MWRRFFNVPARIAIGPDPSHRCRSSPTRTPGPGRAQSRPKVTAREMPPWHIDRNVGITKFKDDPSLTDAEIATIARWVDGGRAAGEPGRHAGSPAVLRDRQVVHRKAGRHRGHGQALCPARRRPGQHRRRAHRSRLQGRHVRDGDREQADGREELQRRPSLHDQPGRGPRRGSDRPVPERVRARQERRHLSAQLRAGSSRRAPRSTSTCT